MGRGSKIFSFFKWDKLCKSFGEGNRKIFWLSQIFWDFLKIQKKRDHFWGKDAGFCKGAFLNIWGGAEIFPAKKGGKIFFQKKATKITQGDFFLKG